MNEQEVEIDRLIVDFARFSYAEPTSAASPDNDLKISHPNYPHPNSSSRLSIPDEDVLEKFRYLAGSFLELHRQHLTPPDSVEALRAHLGGSCTHLRDHYRRAPLPRVPHIQAHVNSNCPYERLCIACIRRRRDVERYQCTTCGGRNPTRSQFQRRTAVEITEVPSPPLTWHVPMCRRCRQVIATAYKHLLPTTEEEVYSA